jgi:aromatic-L-amino-acid/L-tryptophan decarboxylase
MTREPADGEETLDPADWDALRALGHRMLDDMMTHLQTVRERPVWQPMPAEVAQAFTTPVPAEGAPAEQVYAEFLETVVPYNMGNIHPRFWGWVMGNGTPLGMLADMLAAGLNPNMGGGDHAGPRVEQQVINWLKEMLGYPAEASGLLVSGGSMANLVALTVARSARAGFDVRAEGLAAAPAPLTIYGSVEMHSSIQKAVELLGLGSQALRLIPVDADFRIDLALLRQAIEADIAAGRRPICLVGNAGAVNTGALDPLDALAGIAAEYDLWFHVDGAFGALAYLAPDLRPLLAGMERADSLAFDLHKWVYVPFECGCALVRNPDAHRRAFSLTPEYLSHADRGLAAGALWFSDYGVQLTRGFRALKVWMTLKNSGVDKIGRVIRQNVAQAAYLGRRVAEAPDLELLAPVALNVVCFRYVAPGLHGAALDALNTELLTRLQESGVAAPSGTRVRGAYAIRCAITNHRSRMADFDLLLDETRRLGAALLAEARAPEAVAP